MKKGLRLKNLKILLFIIFLISIAWTGLSTVAKPENMNEEISLLAIPEYQIVSSKAVIPYPAGTVFEQGMAAYFYSVLPELRITPKVSVSGINQALLQGSMVSKVVLQSVDDKMQPYWQYLLYTTTNQEFTLSKGVNNVQDQLSFQSDVNRIQVTSLYERMTQIADELGFQNGLSQIMVITEIHIQGTANGISFDRTISLTVPFTLQNAFFTVPKSQDLAKTMTMSAISDHLSEQNILLTAITEHLPLVILNLILLFAVVFLTLYEYKNIPKEANAHKRFREWITEGSVDILDKLQVNVFHLEGLVDIAIDLNKRVIYDREKEKYYVLTEDMVYLFDPERIKSLNYGRQKLGKMLVEMGLIRTDQLEIGLYYHKKTGSRLGESLIALGFIEEVTLYSTLASQQGLDYYELEPDIVHTYEEWKDKLNIQKARALSIIPLGMREDGKLVIACGEIYKEGLRSTLEELFGQQIYIVSSKPSAIHRALGKLEASDHKWMYPFKDQNKELINSPVERLLKEELNEFQASYVRGQINQKLLIKAAGIVNDDFTKEAFVQEHILNWLLEKKLIDTELPGLIQGISQAVHSMEYGLRKEHQVPTLLEILYQANYLTNQTLAVILNESEALKITPELLLIKNYYASKNTIEKVHMLQNVLDQLLNQS